MNYYEVLIADRRYHGDEPLTYQSEQLLSDGSLVSIPLGPRTVNGFIYKKVAKPKFATKPIKMAWAEFQLPAHAIDLASWIKNYYACSLGEALSGFAPSGTQQPRANIEPVVDTDNLKLGLDTPLTKDQQEALSKIATNPSRTVLLHGETGSGKTRVYLELAAKSLAENASVILLTPEIGLTAQLATITKAKLDAPIYIWHSQLTPAQQKKQWLAVASATEPVVIIGARSALFAPVRKVGLIVIDEAHEPAYKQDQAPRYHAVRVASQLGSLTNSRVILGTATPTVSDYYLAENHKAVVRMKQLAVASKHPEPKIDLVDLRDRSNFSPSYYLSRQLLKSLKETLAGGQQAIIYLNRRGSARLLVCANCGWRLLCPNCDIPLVYHADKHEGLCHSCGYHQTPPPACPVCGSPDILYKSAGTKALAENLQQLFPNHRVARFDSDNATGENLHELWQEVKSGQIDILVGTQILAKGLDLPKLGLVGVVLADSSLALPDYSAEERTFQLLYQIIGRVGRGHGHGRVIVQSFEPDSPTIQAAIHRDWASFYKTTIKERQTFRFPPFAYLLKLVARRTTLNGAKEAASKLKRKLGGESLPVEIIGPVPSFRARRGSFYYYQLVLKAKRREHLVKLAKLAGDGWGADLDATDLL